MSSVVKVSRQRTFPLHMSIQLLFSLLKEKANKNPQTKQKNTQPPQTPQKTAHSKQISETPLLITD